MNSGPVYPEAVTTPASDVASEPADGSGDPSRPGSAPLAGASGQPPQHLMAKHRMGPARRTVREIGLALITLGVIVLLFVAYQLWGTSIAEGHSQANLKKSFTAQLAQNRATGSADNPAVGGTTAPQTLGTPTGGAIDELRIPKIGVDKYVVEGVSEQDLRRGPGHYTNTPMPGQNGNAAIAGHRTTYGAPFFDLNELSPGDDIYITDTAGKTFDYKVTGSKVVSPNDVSVLDPTNFPQLTLTTCNPRFSASSRLIVFARLAPDEPPLPTPPTTLAPPSQHAAPPTLASDNLGKGNSRAWPPVFGYGALVVVLWILVRLLINRTRRWARLGAYVGGIAICLVPLWFCFENVVLLLPQNI